MSDLPSRLLPSQPVKRHYPSNAARMADLIVHVVGLTLAVAGGAVLLGFAISSSKPGLIAAIAVYALGVVTMLALSLAYNFAPPEKRAGRNKFDHAGIFLMIGASYTPFTTQALSGAWAWSMTVAVWAIVGLCVLGKLLEMNLPKKLWIAIYTGLGWFAVIALMPLTASLNWISLLLLFMGGLVYSIGIIFHVKRSIPFSRAIWHGHVVTAAAVHWAAIFVGVVLLPGVSV